MRKLVTVAAIVGFVSVSSTAYAVVLCAKPRSDGTFNSSVRIREACTSRETQIDPVALGLQGPQGPQGEEYRHPGLRDPARNQ